jgi:4-amino-4-deoxy-L-arabinose transferase-like glycosyltransferase
VRFPNLAASLLSIVLVYRLGRRLYGCIVGRWAALMLALSPFDVLFARTAFTDSVLVVWTLAALCAAVNKRWFAAGALLGLAFATKQHALLLIPLVLGAGLIQLDQKSAASTSWKSAVRAGFCICMGFLIPLAGVVAWDAARWAHRPSYWHQSAMSYGGLAWAPLAKWGPRALEWLSWGRYLFGPPVLAVLAVLGCLASVALGWLRRPNDHRTWFDTLWVLFGLGYLAVHTILRFSIWDRYLLPLASLAALLLARVIVQLAASCQDGGRTRARTRQFRLSRLAGPLRVPILSFVLGLTLFAGYQAAHNGYPIGGEHWAYQGIDEIAAFLVENAPANAVIYHHWLRWHYSYYLHDTTFELRWWESGEHLRQEAFRTFDRAQYIVLPDWRTLEPDAPGLRFELLYRARRQDDSVSLSLYRILPQVQG